VQIQSPYQSGSLIDHYQIICKLGGGFASQVFLAQDLHAQQEVVLKIPKDDVVGGAAIFKRYQREAEIGKQLSHPNLQRHLNQDEQRSKEYLVLEYLPGQTVRAMLLERDLALLPEAEVRRILLQVCEALVYTHKMGVIHRDVKPENILLTPDGDVKLLDFGIALLATDRQNAFRSFSSPIGTPDYMSPERLQGNDGDERSDVYAVGIVLYELLCGRLPFGNLDGFPLTSQQLSDDPPGILAFNPSLSPALATVVMRAIRREPGKRYTSMRELYFDLGHLDEVIPIDYLPDRPRLSGRYWPIIRIVLVILLVCLAVVAFGIFAQAMHPVVR